MSSNLKQDSVKEMLNMLKGDYNFPVKLWVWGKVVKEWAGIIIGTAIFLLIALGVVFAIKGAGAKVEYVNSSQQTVMSIRVENFTPNRVENLPPFEGL